IPFFWPLTGERYGNWGPIPVSDLALEIPDPRRSRALRSELLWVWLPTGAFVSVLALFRFVRRRRLAVRQAEPVHGLESPEGASAAPSAVRCQHGGPRGTEGRTVRIVGPDSRGGVPFGHAPHPV